MLVTLIIILILIWAAVVWSIYSNFLVFYSNFSESENYHKAYYASISALERWELVVKQREPWYEWSGGFIMWSWQGSTNNTDWWIDNNLSWFSYLWDYKDDSTVFRTINSRTTRIPSLWNGDVEEMLKYTNLNNLEDLQNSDNYNMMDYEDAEVFLLYNDNLQGSPYQTGWLENANVKSISWEIRLPALLSGKFWPLDTSKSLIGMSDTLPADDAIVDRQIRWQINSWWILFPFTLYSTPNIKFWWWAPKVNYNKDIVFRESDINNVLKFKFYDISILPDREVLPTIISQVENIIKNYFNSLQDSQLPYSKIFQQNNPQLRFGLLNLVEWYDGSTWHIYPFLEYYADFWTWVPDKYFTINAEWSFKDFQINTIVQKPTMKESILWNFTSIF